MKLESFDIGIITVGFISCIAALCVMLTFLNFPAMRKKRFMKFIFYISFSDFFVGIASIIGFPRQPGLCTLQGSLATFFSNASWLWATALSYTMYSIIQYGSTTSDKYLHIICWCIPLINTFSPLLFGRFRYQVPDPREQWCFLQAPSTTPFWLQQFVSFGMYWAWLFLCVVLMSFWGVVVYVRLYRGRQARSADIIRRMYDKVWLYPLIIGSCWVTNFLVDGTATQDSVLLAFFSMLAGTINGLLTAILFFWKSDEARYRWKSLLTKNDLSVELLYHEIPIDFEPDESYLDDSVRNSLTWSTYHESECDTRSDDRSHSSRRDRESATVTSALSILTPSLAAVEQHSKDRDNPSVSLASSLNIDL